MHAEHGQKHGGVVSSPPPRAWARVRAAGMLRVGEAFNEGLYLLTVTCKRAWRTFHRCLYRFKNTPRGLIGPERPPSPATVTQSASVKARAWAANTSPALFNTSALQAQSCCSAHAKNPVLASPHRGGGVHTTGWFRWWIATFKWCLGPALREKRTRREDLNQRILILCHRWMCNTNLTTVC